MIEIEPLSSKDKKNVRKLLLNHFKFTKSRRAENLLNDFEKAINRFVKVMPAEYKRVLENKVIEEDELSLLEISDG